MIYDNGGNMDIIKERYELAVERINEIEKECGVTDGLPEKEAWAFRSTAAVWKRVFALNKLVNEGKGVYGKTPEELKKFYDELYANVFPGAYEKSIENPAYAVKKLKRKTGRLLSVVASEPYGSMNDAANNNLEAVTIKLELFIEVYCIFKDAYEEFDSAAEASKNATMRARKAYYSFKTDYLDFYTDAYIDGRYSDTVNRPRAIIDADLTDLRYLYMYGDYVNESELKIAAHLNTFSDEEMDRMAETLVEGFMRGFRALNGKFKENGLADLTFPTGFERMAKHIFKSLEKRKCRCSVKNSFVFDRYGDCYGIYPENLNSQFYFDHLNDRALWYDRKFVSNSAESLKN